MDEGKAIASCSSTTTGVENTIEEITDQTECPVDCYINRIPSELLNIIFSFLSIEQRIGIERVCKHWRFVNHTIPWYETNYELSFDCSTNKCEEFVMKKILSRCGFWLRKVNLRGQDGEPLEDVLLLLSIYCPNLEFVSIQNMGLTDFSFKIFSEKCNRLKEIKLDFCTMFIFKYLHYVFKNCNLRRVIIRRDPILASSLVYLNDDIERVDLSCCLILESEKLITLSERKNLRDLRLNYTNLDDMDFINIFSAFKTKLTHLEIEGLSDYVSENTLKEGLTCYENLTHLNLAHNETVTDNVIDVVIKNCSQLELLNINNTSITDASLILLRELKNIRSLHISYMENLSEAGFIKLTDFDVLETLQVQRSPQFSDTACIALLQNCNNLKFLDISSCDNITNVTIQAVSTINRDDNIITLRIIAGGTRITEFKKSPSLSIEDINLCPKDYRINYNEYSYSFKFFYENDSDSDHGYTYDYENDSGYIKT